MGQSTDYKVSDKVFTIPNLLSAIRLCMIPGFLVLLFNDFNLAATLVFAVAASTDWVDGQVARRTNSVSKLGQLLDPFVDRFQAYWDWSLSVVFLFGLLSWLLLAISLCLLAEAIFFLDGRFAYPLFILASFPPLASISVLPEFCSMHPCSAA